MNCGKVHSNGRIPFSWEDKAGVRKTPHHDYSTVIGSVGAIPQKSSSTLPPPPTPNPAIQGIKIPPPPCLSQPPRRSTSRKAFRWQEDPFLVAYRECTKTHKFDKLAKGVGSTSSVRKSKSIFSCKKSSDARHDNFLKLSQLPRLPNTLKSHI